MLPYILSPYDCVLPVDKNGLTTGTALDIQAGKTNPLSEKFFIQGPNTYTFICPDGGATTDRKDPNARVELHDTRTFTIKDHAVDSPYNVTVTQLANKARTVIGQIHDAKESKLKVVWTQDATGSSLDARIKLADGTGDTTFNLLKGLKIGDTLKGLKMEYLPAGFNGNVKEKIVVTVNGHKTEVNVKYSGIGVWMKFCRGNYRFTTGAKDGNLGILVHS